MSKIIAKLQSPIDKVSGHKYTGFTIKAPFINFSFAPTIFTAPNGAVFVSTIRTKPGQTEKSIVSSQTSINDHTNPLFRFENYSLHKKMQAAAPCLRRNLELMSQFAGRRNHFSFHFPVKADTCPLNFSLRLQRFSCPISVFNITKHLFSMDYFL